MKYLINYSLIAIGLLINGCSSHHDGEDEHLVSTENMVVESSLQSKQAPSGELVLNFHTHQMVGDFTARLAHQLLKNSYQKEWEGDIVIASFVNFDDTLKESNALGNLISENLLGDMQLYDVPVLDVHMKGWLEINNTGDYIFSRDGDEIAFNENIKYVLSGVMVRVERGIKVNARIIELNSQKIISTSTVLIPNYLLDTI